MALRRLIYQLDWLGLPIDGYWRRDGGLAFDLLSSHSTGERITIGHADGVITIDLVESLDAYRETLRVRLGEPYRTMLGRFRHEAGHYYQNILVETGQGRSATSLAAAPVRRRAGQLRRCRWRGIEFRGAAGLAGALHLGVRDHAPVEDFAECFAHYLHITDTIDTARRAAWCRTSTGSGSPVRWTSFRWSRTLTP